MKNFCLNTGYYHYKNGSMMITFECTNLSQSNTYIKLQILNKRKYMQNELTYSIYNKMINYLYLVFSLRLYSALSEGLSPSYI